MPQRARKFFGTILLVVFVSLYALTAMVIAAAKLQDTSHLVQFAYFLVAGLAWVVPAGALILWMGKPDKTRP